MKLATVVLATALGAAASAQNLIGNGSFETLGKTPGSFELANRLVPCFGSDLVPWQVPPTQQVDLFIRNRVTSTPHCRNVVEMRADNSTFGSLSQPYPAPPILNGSRPSEMVLISKLAAVDPAFPAVGVCGLVANSTAFTLPFSFNVPVATSLVNAARFYDRVAHLVAPGFNSFAAGVLSIAPCGDAPYLVDDVYLMPLYSIDQVCSPTGVALRGHAVSNGCWFFGDHESLMDTGTDCPEDTMFIESYDCATAPCEVQPCRGSLYVADWRGAAPNIATTIRIRRPNNDPRPVDMQVSYFNWTSQRWEAGGTLLGPPVASVAHVWNTFTIPLTLNPAPFVKASPGGPFILARIDFAPCLRIQCLTMNPGPYSPPISCDGWIVEIDSVHVN